MQHPLLEQINSPDDLKSLSKDELPKLAEELRDFIIHVVAAKEGHLGASLGVIELTIALHYEFNTPTDLLVWDVGHQAYGHKILTGRRKNFDTNRQLNGISGFPKISESEYDVFGTGHSSTAISATLGMALANQIRGEGIRQHIAVVGDASIASGMAFEALNHAGISNTNILIILNDNAIGIDPSVGALKKYLTNVSLNERPDTDNIFEALNFNYSGPVDGHDINILISEFNRLKRISGPKLLHVITKKGKGLVQAENDQVTYHAPGKFNAKTGRLIASDNSHKPPKYQDVFGESIVELASKNEKIIGITPAMPSGCSLKYMMDMFPERAFDVGIAEQHAVTFSAGLATQDMIVFCNIYSTFLQRAYDQVIHDVCLQKLPVIFCLDRSGIVGQDGATHHGIFDISYLRCIPNLILFAPRNEVELRNIMYTAQLGLSLPIAIRYPRGRGTMVDWKKPFSKIKIGEGVTIKKGSSLAILPLGNMVEKVLSVIAEIKENDAIGCFDMRFIKPMDEQLMHTICKQYPIIISVEDGIIQGGFGSAISEFMARHHYTNKLIMMGIDEHFPDHGTVEELHDLVEISKEKIKDEIEKHL
jgi:1-deoxy-D-xylulose-5-phosphate synthase